MFNRCVDLCYLTALATVGFRLRQDRTMWWGSYLVLWFCVLKSATGQIVDIGMHVWQYGLPQFFEKWRTPWNVTVFPAEAFVLVSLFVLLWDSQPSDDPDVEPVFLKRHPVWLAYVCGAKWFEFLASCLCIRSLGIHVLPAVNAMFSKESVWFLVFVLFCVGADFGDYYMFPIPENYKIGRGTHGWGTMFANEGWREFLFGVMKIFRLDIMGDFDLWELQGLDPEIKTTAEWDTSKLRNDTEVAYMDEPHIPMPYRRWHYGIRAFFIFSCILIHLMIMNVYIGLLTKIYEKRASKKRQLLAEFRMVFALKQLHCRLPVAELRKRLGIAPREERSGVWISYDPELFRNESHGQSGRGQISDPEDEEGLHFY